MLYYSAPGKENNKKCVCILEWWFESLHFHISHLQLQQPVNSKIWVVRVHSESVLLHLNARFSWRPKHLLLLSGVSEKRKGFARWGARWIGRIEETVLVLICDWEKNWLRFIAFWVSRFCIFLKNTEKSSGYGHDFVKPVIYFIFLFCFFFVMQWTQALLNRSYP